MNKEFNKNIIFDNISFLLEKYGKKIGELEAEAGVSTGYISRTSKDSGAKPGIDFIVNVADSLKVSVDTLININLSGLTPTELYLISFFEKLKNDTVEDKLEWKKESADYLNRYEPNSDGSVGHPMLSIESVYRNSGDGYPYEDREVIMPSNTYENDTYIKGDCFHLNMKNMTKLYIMNVGRVVHNSGEKDETIIEIWMSEFQLGKQFLGSSAGKNKLAVLVKDLYQTILEFSKYPKIKAELRSVIDSYINYDDLSDDMPF